MSIGLLYLAGAGLAVFALACAHWLTRSPARALATMLLAAALIYVGFAVAGRAGWTMLVLDLCGVAVFGSFAWAGTRFSLVWLAAGWALHAVWDVALHLYGVAAGTAPDWYAHLCVSFDLVVAGVLSVVLLRRPAIRAAASMRGRNTAWRGDAAEHPRN